VIFFTKYTIKKSTPNDQTPARSFLCPKSYQGLIPLDTIYLFAFSSAFTQSSNFHSNYLNNKYSALRFQYWLYIFIFNLKLYRIMLNLICFSQDFRLCVERNILMTYILLLLCTNIRIKVAHCRGKILSGFISTATVNQCPFPREYHRDTGKNPGCPDLNDRLI